MHTKEQVIEGIGSLHQVYFFTVKPPRDLIEFAFREKSKVLNNYFIKRNMISFHADCISRKGYRHYHGIVKLNTVGEKEKVLKAMQRYVNRNYGYFKIEPIKYSVSTAYDYIMDAEGNKPSQTYSNFI